MKQETVALARAFLASLDAVKAPVEGVCVFCGGTHATRIGGNGIRLLKIRKREWRGREVSICHLCEMSLGYSVAKRGAHIDRMKAGKQLDKIPELLFAEWAARRILKEVRVIEGAARRTSHSQGTSR